MGLIIRIPEFPLNMDCLHVAQPNHALSLSANDQRVEMILTTDAYHYTCMVDYSLHFMYTIIPVQGFWISFG